jgi:hypothetical protein
VTMRSVGKHQGPLLLVLSVLLLSCTAHRPPSGGVVADEYALADVDSKLATLGPILRGYPPHVSSEEERERVTREWQETEDAIKELAAAYPKNAGIEWRLGELYRFGHNLDVPDAGAKCVAHLERAIALRPDYVDAYFELVRGRKGTCGRVGRVESEVEQEPCTGRA